MLQSVFLPAFVTYVIFSNPVFSEESQQISKTLRECLEERCFRVYMCQVPHCATFYETK